MWHGFKSVEALHAGKATTGLCFLGVQLALRSADLRGL